MSKTFITTDIFLCSTLLSLHFTLKGVEPSKDRRIKFILEGDELDKYIQDYWSKNLRLEPQELFANLKMLKSRIYS